MPQVNITSTEMNAAAPRRALFHASVELARGFEGRAVKGMSVWNGPLALAVVADALQRGSRGYCMWLDPSVHFSMGMSVFYKEDMDFLLYPIPLSVTFSILQPNSTSIEGRGETYQHSSHSPHKPISTSQPILHRPIPPLSVSISATSIPFNRIHPSSPSHLQQSHPLPPLREYRHPRS